MRLNHIQLKTIARSIPGSNCPYAIIANLRNDGHDVHTIYRYDGKSCRGALYVINGSIEGEGE